jgi:hypothetical protein
MTSRVTRSRSHAGEAPESDTLSVLSSAETPSGSELDAEIESLVSDAANKGKGKERENDSEITRADLMDMLQMQKDMLRQSTLESQSLRETIIAMAKPATELPIRATSRKLVDPAKYCGGAQDLDRFITQLRHRYKTQPHQFHGDDDKVDYALSLLGKWANNDDAELRKTMMTNPAEWGTSLVTMTSPCLSDFTLFEAEIRKMYGDKDRRLNAAIKAATETTQGQHPAENTETVRNFANRIRTNWREAGWDETAHSTLLYDLAWAGLRPVIRARIRPFANETTGMFESIDQLFDKAAGAETKVQPSKPQNQNQDQNQNQTTNTPSHQKGRKRQLTTSDGGPGHSQSQTENKPKDSKLPPAPWVSSEIFQSRVDAKNCRRCAGDHFTHRCPTYGPAKMPDQLKTPGGGHNVKRQKSFDTERPKN